MNIQKKEQDYVSILSWMVMLFVLAIPGVNIIVTLLWAFIGKNRTQRNYFRAIIAWQLVCLLLFLVFVTLGLFAGFWVLVLPYAQTLLDKLRLFLNPS